VTKEGLKMPGNKTAQDVKMICENADQCNNAVCGHKVPHKKVDPCSHGCREYSRCMEVLTL